MLKTIDCYYTYTWNVYSVPNRYKIPLNKDKLKEILCPYLEVSLYYLPDQKRRHFFKV